MKKWIRNFVLAIVIVAVVSFAAMAAAPGASTVHQGRVVIVTTGTAVVLGGAGEMSWFILMAGYENTFAIVIGSSTVTYTGAATDGIRLRPGERIQILNADRGDLYFNGTAADALYFLAATTD